MSLVINTNIASITAQRNLASSSNALATSIQRLSSGLRINSAKDDAAGLAVSETLRAHIKSIAVAVRNSQDGISLSQTAEGGLVEVGSILARLRELAEQAANGSIADGSSAKSALDNEYQQLISEINRISEVTEFNGVKLLNGSQCATGITLQVGFQNTSNDRITFFSGINSLTAATLSITATVASTIVSAANAQSALTIIDAAITTVASRRGTLGAIQNRLESTISNLRIESENLSAADSRIRDADFAYETAVFTKNQILLQAGTAVLAQANVIPQHALTLLK